jgi:hypothetical protein
LFFAVIQAVFALFCPGAAFFLSLSPVILPSLSPERTVIPATSFQLPPGPQNEYAA